MEVLSQHPGGQRKLFSFDTPKIPAHTVPHKSTQYPHPLFEWDFTSVRLVILSGKQTFGGMS
jgi:hypothetical protein